MFMSFSLQPLDLGGPELGNLDLGDLGLGSVEGGPLGVMICGHGSRNRQAVSEFGRLAELSLIHISEPTRPY